MKKIVLFILSIIVVVYSYAQKDTIVMRYGGLYALRVSIVDKTICPHDNKFIVYKIQIDSVIYYGDTILYRDTNELMQIDRVYSRGNKEELYVDSSYRIMVEPSWSYTYVEYSYLFSGNEVIIDKGERRLVPVRELSYYIYYKEKKFKKFWYTKILGHPEKFYNLPKKKKFYRKKAKIPKYTECFDSFNPQPVLRERLKPLDAHE